MTSSDWSEAWKLFREVLDLPDGERRLILDAAPPHIAAEVQAMIEEDRTEPEAPKPGDTWGRYTLVAPLGAGGMGEVFSARDAELGRTVAVKFVGARGRLLPAACERLIREAQAASALNHPNLVTVHEVLRFDHGAALVTELVNGQSLRVFCGVARPIQQVAAWGAQIAQALAAAHAESIVHSDIKPENIMVRHDGYIKILDFGLAQSIGLASAIERLPLGTLGYMSPEQTRGEALTGASDVFSLGVTLVELATGLHPFLAATARETTIAIARRDVGYRAPSLPAGRAFADLVRAMLAKDPARRPGMSEVAARLERISHARAGGLRRGIGIAAAAAAMAGGYLWLTSRPATPRFAAPVAITKYSGIEQQPAMSPDGQRIAFIWSGPDGQQDDLYVRSAHAVDETPRRLTDDANHEFSPAWSPDGRYLAWHRRALGGGDGELWVAAVDGSAPARLVATVFNDGGFFGLAWSPESTSLIARDKGPEGYPLTRIRLADGAKSFLTGEPAMQDHLPALSPDRKRLLFFRYNLASPQLCHLELEAVGARPVCRELRTGLGSATWTLDSRSMLVATGDALWLASTSSSEPMTKLLDGVFSNLSTDAAGGRYVFNRTITDANIWQYDIESQRATQLISSSEEDSEPQFSPDGSRILFRSKRTGFFELYVCNRDGSGVRQLTHVGSHCGSARWSPDGKWIAYDSTQDAPGPQGKRRFDNIYVMPAEGGPARRLTADDANSVVPNWSADSRSVYFARDKERQAWKVPVDGGPAVMVSDGEMWQAVESADGRWIWYEQPTTGKGLWRRPVGGGPDERVPGSENLTYRTWEVRGDLLVFLRTEPDAGFYRLRPSRGLSSPAQRVGPQPRRLLLGPGTMSVSPDGRTILYTSEDVTLGDIYALTPVGAR